MKVDLSVSGTGQQLEKSTVEYIHGGGMMLPGLEKVLEGLEKGAKLVAGEKFAAKAENDMNVVLLLEKVGDTEVDVRYMHPLGEKEIKYSVEVLQVSDPRPPPMPAQALELEPEES